MLRQRPFYIPSLDGLRGIAILLVFLAHLGLDKVVPGGLGVTIFFFISGYIITKLLIDEINVTGNIDLKLFYIRRLLRLYPALLLMILISVSYLFLIHDPVEPHEVVASLFYYENYYFFNHPATSSNVCKILWSLAVEEHFYIVFPALLLFCYRFPKTLLAILILLTIICLIFRCVGVLHYSYSVDITERYCYTLTHTRFDSIIYGCLSGVLIYGFNSQRYMRILANQWVFLLALSVMVFCLLFRDTTFRNTVRYSLQGLSLFVIIPAIINGRVYPLFNSLLSNKFIVFIGKISYSIYLMHMIAITSMIRFIGINHPWLYYISVTIMTVLLSFASYFIIEKPLMKFRLKFARTTM